MKTQTNCWFSLSSTGSTALRCAECSNSFDLGGPSADHHSAVCPICGVECIYLDWKERIIQVVLKNAPPVFAKAIKIMQDRLDELDYVELLVALEELAVAVCKPSP